MSPVSHIGAAQAGETGAAQAAQLAQLPQLRALVPQAMPWHPLQGGKTNQLWRVGDVVVKLYSQPGANPLFPNQPDAEILALQALQGRGLAPQFLGQAATPLGRCVVYRHMPGQPGSAGPAQVAGLLARLHQQPRPAQALRHISASAGAVMASAQAILGLCRDRAAFSDPPDMGPAVAVPLPAPVFLHGDPVPANIVHAPQAPHGPCLIDWQCPGWGPAAHDLAIYLSAAMQLLYQGQPLPRRAQAQVLAAYPDAAAVAHYRAVRPLFAWRMAAYCQWRLEQGQADYAAARDAELASLVQD